jgi:hypothetical protein
MPSLKVNIVSLLDVPQLLMLFVATLIYLKTKQFILIMFYNGTFLVTEILIIFETNIFFITT